ncbi:MAG: Asp-tRNA(Asn)/Glu-tRNA(Gln) amidotransferase subunit GatB [Clostridia bacterium]|nr:Asp-tRNA(Asn)/Glu-tRNA(Gln) amidotransferase subunit GatB [Clostridia bacterium]
MKKISIYDEYESVIGVEVHVELSTASKIFCGCSTAFGGEPNTDCCPVCMGLPGTLPVLNDSVVEYAIKAGLATNCEINLYSQMDRKNYFYPDSPKAFQISQNSDPIAINGHLDVLSGEGLKRIGITRIHMEEDAGKLIHDDTKGTLIDYNRCGVPLIEIVSEPDMRSADEVKSFLQKLRAIVIYLGITTGKMNEGAFRCDVNLSVRKKGVQTLGTRTEMKNLNSFAFVTKAIEVEMKRQIDVLEKGGTITQETRRWDPAKKASFAMRSKEDAHDYRYFPDPDLMPVILDQHEVDRINDDMPMLPDEYLNILTKKFGLKYSLAEQIISNKNVADFTMETIGKVSNAELFGNLITNVVIDDSSLEINVEQMIELIHLLDSGKINSGIAKKVFEFMMKSGEMPTQIIEIHDLWPITSVDALTKMAIQLLDSNPKIVEDYKSGKIKAKSAYLGLMMKETSGKADPNISEEIFDDLLKKM